MKDKAIAKMTAECERLSDSSDYETLVGMEERYTSMITDAVAEKLLAEGKSLQGALKEIYDYAAENRKSGARCVLVGPTRGFEIADEYFGITKEDWKLIEKTDKPEIDILDFL